MNNVRAMSAKELLETVTPESTRAHEAVFRRGYMHGAEAVLQAWADGVPLSVAEEWLDGPLMDWRFKAPRENLTMAPIIKRPTGGAWK